MNTVLFFILLLAGLAGVLALCLVARRNAEPADMPVRCVRAVGLALVLYWFLRTAAERRIGLGFAGLFSFMSDGRLLPGRLAVLCLCVLFSLAVFLTRPGDRLRAWLTRAAEKDGALWVFSLCATVLIVLWTMRVSVLSYMTNDEVYIIGTIVRTAQNGLSSAVSSFTHVFFCGLLSVLYSLAPDILWYLGYHVLTITLSLVVIGRCVLLKARRRGWTIALGLLLMSCVHGLFLYSFAKLSFTVTPAIVGTAAVALILCRGDVPRRGPRIVLDVLGVVLMVLCYLQRPVTARCILCFWGLACAYHVVRMILDDPKRWLRRLFSIVPYVLVVLLLFAAAKGVTRSDTYGQSSEYATAEYYRSRVVDFLIDDITYEEYESVGIPKELAVMLHGWFFLDERINTDTFRELVKLHTANTRGSVSLVSYLRQFLTAVGSDPQMGYRMAALLLILLAAVIWLIRYRRRSLPEFLTALCACGGAAILWLYLVSEGRFLIRVFLVVYYPALTIVLLTSLSAADGSDPVSSRRCRITDTLGGLAVVCFCAACLLCVSIVPHIQESVAHDDVFAEEMAVESYVSAQPDKTFITNIYETNLDPIHSTRYPGNKVLWGACGDTYRTDRMYADAFFRNDTRFLCQKPGYIQFLLQYLTLDYGPVYAVMEDNLINDIVVYDIEQILPDGDYTGWYEWNGLTYYFRDGQAVAGTQVIDGVEYEFSPAGAESYMRILDTENGQYYVTLAYSLAAESEP